MAFDASTLKRPLKLYDFTDHSRRAPRDQQPGDRLDAQFADLSSSINALINAFNDLVAAERAAPAPKTPLPSSPSLYVNAGGPYASDTEGADATAADYAQVAIDWAEYMPDTIPPNILAINAITGSHWSSRWWANKFADIAAVLGSGNLAIAAELMTFADGALGALSHPPADPQTTMQLIVNGRVFSAVGSPTPFTVSGNSVLWTHPYFGLGPGDEIVARYRFAVQLPASVAYRVTSLFYPAAQGQTAFPLGDADRFGFSYALTPYSVVSVTRNGVRLSPPDGYLVVDNVVRLAWPAGDGESVIVDIDEKRPTDAVPPPPPSPPSSAVSLYYVASAAQTNFPLSTPDRFGSFLVLTPFSIVRVSRNGARLMPDDGTGVGGYVVVSNAVILLQSAGAGETIIVDVWEP